VLLIPAIASIVVRLARGLNTNMNWSDINDWFDKFYEETVEAKKLVRGRAFSGAKIEIYGRDSISIVLHNPYTRGITEDEKAIDFVRSIENEDAQEVYTDFNYERFARIVMGEDTIKEDDWIWEDET